MDFTSGGAEAVKAMNGASVSALSLPSCRNAVLNFSPLLSAYKWSHYFHANVQTNHSEMQCASSIAILVFRNKFLQGLVVAVSGDMNTKAKAFHLYNSTCRYIPASYMYIYVCTIMYIVHTHDADVIANTKTILSRKSTGVHITAGR